MTDNRSLAKIVLALLVAVLSVSVSAEEAIEESVASTPGPAINSEQASVRGRDLMTESERMSMRQKMRTADSDETRAKLRAENHARMQARAEKRGLRLAPPTDHKSRGANARMRNGQGAATSNKKNQPPCLGAQQQPDCRGQNGQS